MSYLCSDDIIKAFHGCGVRNGDTVMLHSDSIFLAQLPLMPPHERCNIFFSACEEVLGSDGTLVLPTFTYSFTRGEVYSPLTTPSSVGVLSEHFRSLPNVGRSRDPLFSVAARGRYADSFSQADPSDCFGSKSAFGLLELYNAWIVCIGCNLDRITFTHYVEQKFNVDYRYFKSFSGIICDSEYEAPADVRYFVRDLNRDSAIDLSLLSNYLMGKNLLMSAPVGRFRMYAIRVCDFLEGAKSLLQKNPVCLIKEGNKGIN